MRLCEKCRRVIDKVVVRYFCPKCGAELPPPDKLPRAVIIPSDWKFMILGHEHVIAFKDPDSEEIRLAGRILDKLGEKLPDSASPKAIFSSSREGFPFLQRGDAAGKRGEKR